MRSIRVTIHKLVFDTDEGTGCRLFLKEEKAVKAYADMARKLRGYKGEDDADEVSMWLQEDEQSNGMGCRLPADTFFLDSEELNIPVPW